MKLDKHIINRLLNDKTFAAEITIQQGMVEKNMTYTQFCDWMMDFDFDKNKEVDDERGSFMGCFKFLQNDDNKTYFVTSSVIENLKYFDAKKALDIEGWKVFASLADFKKTFILPSEGATTKAVRINKIGNKMMFWHFSLTPDNTKDNWGELYWVLLWIDMDTNICSHFYSEDGQRLAPFLYSLLCFTELTHNEEIEIPAGRKYGTMKSSKLINSMQVPITAINSRWNVTTVRHEGFTVSGHIRLQPYGQAGAKYYQLIYIEPYQKEGYTRRSGKEMQNL